MSHPDEPSQPSGLDDLFSNLPTAASPLPQREAQEEPAPDSRRARRQARASDEGSVPAVGATPAAADAGAVAPAAHAAVTAPLPDSTPPRPELPEPAADAPVASAAVPPAESEHPEEFNDLFAPEQHVAAPRKKRGKGCLIGLIVVLVVFGGIAAGGAWVYNTYQDKINDMMGWGEPKDYEAGQASGEALVTIKKGDTGSPISTALFSAGVTKTDRVFYEYLLEHRPTATFYPGVYKLQKKMTAEAAMKALDDSTNRMENTVRIAEGGTVASSLPRIVDGVGLELADLEAAVKDPKAFGVQAQTLEGWLFPAVYTFDPGVTAKDVIQRMVDRTRESLKKAGVPDADAQRVLTIASIIEREARTPDFAKVSRVIENRLDDGMQLQMDSTAQYGFGELHAGKASTSKQAQRDDNPWNTYVITGLPATPIANPGDAAIDAAMHPADGPWLYFVTVNMNTGETEFTTTYAEHQRAIKKMQAWCKANPGTGC